MRARAHGTSCRGRFVSHWPRRRAALFRMQICRRGALSPSMECGSGTVNLKPQERCAGVHSHTLTPRLSHTHYIYCGIFSASRVTLLVNNLFCVVFTAVRKKKQHKTLTPLFLTLQNFTPLDVLHPAEVSTPNECRENLAGSRSNATYFQL